MKKLIIAGITITITILFTGNVFAKSTRNCKEQKNATVVTMPDLTNEIVKNSLNENEITTVDVDYIIEENGKAYITYIKSENEKAKSEVVKFIESASYNFDIAPGKIYSMKLSISK
ncbi:MAG: hypothetical protein JWN78_2524 [Bacteroidota bacterium]|nr:hypothetical protein [Bacteroidota bacterium]